jgi:MoaA/NifB/PqqE/SkfB family radical SAM enzyme
MCNIWKSTPVAEMPAEHYAKLPTSLRTINITGGEPFLRKDLVEVIRRIDSRAPSSRMVFSTNGFLTETILSALEEVRGFHPSIGVGVSIDGPEDVHDHVRGVDGAFKKAMKTIDGLRSIGLKDLRIGMTLTAENVRYATEVYKLSKDLGVQFTVTFAHNSEIYFQKMDNVPPEFSGIDGNSLSEVLRAQLRSRSAKDWFRAYHIRGIMDKDLRKEFISRCEAGSRFFFISPSGDVFPCMVMNMPIGNLAQVADWDDLFKGGAEERVLKAVQGCREDCWMVCNTRSLIMAHPVRAGAWVTKSKVKAHLGNKGRAKS